MVTQNKLKSKADEFSVYKNYHFISETQIKENPFLNASLTNLVESSSQNPFAEKVLTKNTSSVKKSGPEASKLQLKKFDQGHL